MTSTTRPTPEKSGGKNGHDKKRLNGHSDSLSTREILSALRGFKRGEFDLRLRDDLTGTEGQICEVFNTLSDQMQSLEEEFAELRTAIGKEGRTRRRMKRTGVPGG